MQECKYCERESKYSVCWTCRESRTKNCPECDGKRRCENDRDMCFPCLRKKLDQCKCGKYMAKGRDKCNNCSTKCKCGRVIKNSNFKTCYDCNNNKKSNNACLI